MSYVPVKFSVSSVIKINDIQAQPNWLCISRQTLTRLTALTMTKPLIAGRISEAWMAQVNRICQETGKSHSDVVNEAIAQYLGKTSPESVTSMNKRLTALERKYEKLVKLM